MVLRGLGMSGETGAERIELTVGVDAFCCQLMMITAERLYWQGGGAAEHMRRQFPATGHSSSKCSTVSVMEENLSFPWKPSKALVIGLYVTRISDSSVISVQINLHVLPPSYICAKNTSGFIKPEQQQSS
ncbi:hypothetical protein FQA47_017598 [Oryzias melastigma]|uniref:Uncharacterized protein n=1 Tax=Oryzias melastigma TaxID=30732 RepID=A0A834FFY1_ORYME|nr:hypothetical protein FQA47_017598 [Oryzias melastigma]